MSKLDDILSAEKDGTLSPAKQEILKTLRQRGVIPQSAPSGPDSETDPSESQGMSVAETQSSLLPDFSQQPEGPSRADSMKRDYEKPGAASDIVNFLREFSNAASAGMSEKAGAGLSALGVKNAELTGVAPEGQIGSLGDEFKDALSHQNSSLQDFQGANPKTAFIAKLMGLISPGGVYSSAMKGASEMPIVAKLLGNSKLLARLGGAFLRGGTANATYGLGTESLNPDTKVGDIPIKAAKDFGIGGALDAGTTAAIEGAQAMPGILGKLAGGAKKAALNAAEKLPFGMGQTIKDARLESFGNDVGDLAKASGAEDAGAAGAAVSSKLGDIKAGVLKNYGELTGSVLNKFGDQPVSAEGLRKGIMNQLDGMGAVDSKGNVIEDSLISSFDPELKPVVQRLATFSDELSKNPTLADMDRITKAMGKLAKFGSANRGPRELIFGSLFNDARSSFLSGIDDVVSKSGGDAAGSAQADSIASARKNVSANLKVDEGEIGKLTDLRPEEIISKASTTGKLHLPSVVDEAIAANPAYKEPIKQAVVADIMRRADNPKNLAKSLDLYDAVLPKLMDKADIEQLAKLAGKANGTPGAFQQGFTSLMGKLKGSATEMGPAALAPRTIAPWLNLIKQKAKARNLQSMGQPPAPPSEVPS